MTSSTASASPSACMSSALKLFDVSMITCVNEALSRPSTRVSSSVVICRASSNCTGRGSRYRPVSCFVSERLSSVRSSRAMFWATSESVYSGIVSRNTSASPRHRSRSSSTTEFAGSAASEQPRFTARLVVPTPPVAPVTAMIEQPAAGRAVPPMRCRDDALQRGRQVFRLERLREELLRPGPHRLAGSGCRRSTCW